MKVLRPYAALCFLGTGLARASGGAGTTECFRELKEYGFVAGRTGLRFKVFRGNKYIILRCHLQETMIRFGLCF